MKSKLASQVYSSSFLHSRFLLEKLEMILKFRVDLIIMEMMSINITINSLYVLARLVVICEGCHGGDLLMYNGNIYDYIADIILTLILM